MSTTADGRFTQTMVLAATGSNASGYAGMLNATTLTVTGAVADLPEPAIAAPASLTTIIGSASQLGSLRITEPNTDTLPLTLILTAAHGVLNAAPAGAGTVRGQSRRHDQHGRLRVRPYRHHHAGRQHDLLGDQSRITITD